jgi:ribose-phosphate pyrophosphokinase
VDELKVFTGNSNPKLAKAITRYLHIPLGKCEVFKFSNDNTFARILENVRERDTFVVQPICTPVNDSLIELLIMIDALKRASAERITAVVPYYGYGRSDRKDQPRIPITARLVADLLTVAGANRLLSVDLHSAQIQGFFNIPVDELTAINLFCDYVKGKNIKNLVVVASDIGIAKQTRDVARRLDAPFALIEQRRIDNKDHKEALNIIGEVKGKTALIVDDEIDTAGSLKNVVDILLKEGAKEVYSCATHPVFSGPAVKRIAESPIKEVIVTDSIPVKGRKKLDKITILSIAPLFGEAIRRIHTGQSVGALFQQEK